MPFGLRLLHLRANGGGEFIGDYYSDVCKTTAIIQQFNLPKTQERNGLDNRDERTIMDVARKWSCAAEDSWGGEMAATAVFLLNRPQNNTLGGDTSFHRMFGKHVDLLRTIGTRPHRGRKANLALPLGHTRYPRNSNFEFISFCDASYGACNPKKVRPTSGSMHFLSGSSFT